MKWKSLKLLLFSSLLSLSFLSAFSSPVSAFSFDNSSNVVFPIEPHIYKGIPASILFSGSNSANDAVISQLTPGVYGDIWWKFHTTIPANSIYTFNLTFTFTNSVDVEYFGLTSGNFSLLHDSCIDRLGTTAALTTLNPTNQLSCTYVFYTQSDKTFFDGMDDSRLFYFRDGSDGSGYSGSVTISAGGYRHINWNGLTADDRAWLESVLPQGSSVSQVEEGVSNALQEQKEAERQELQDAQDDAESSANDSGDEAKEQGETFIQIVRDFVDVTVNLHESDCLIDFDLFDHSRFGRGDDAKTYVVNLCPQPKPFIVNFFADAVLPVVLSVFILRLAVVIIEELYNTWKEYQL